MNGHHGDAVVVGLHAVQVRVQGNFVQEAGQGGVLRILLQEAQDVGFQLLHVLDAAPALHVVLVLQSLHIAGLVADGVVKLRQSQFRSLAAEAVNEVREFQQLGGGTFQLREQIRIADDLIEGCPLALRQHRYLIQSRGADTPGRVIDDATQT